MKINVNLATRPFVEMRPYILRLRWVMVGLALVSVGLLVASHLLQRRLDEAQARMDAIQSRTNAAVAEKQANERRMRQPANAAVLDRAHFLNALFLRKSFSWTAVMMDLETVLPSGVQVTSIEPQVSADGQVTIRMRVGGERDRAVQLVRNLEHSKRFLQPRLNSEAVQAKDQGQGQGALAPGAVGAVEFEILAAYNPLPEGVAYPKVKTVDVETAPKPMLGVSRPPVTPGPVVNRPGVVLKPMPPMQNRPQIPANKPNPQVQQPVVAKPGPQAKVELPVTKGGAA